MIVFIVFCIVFMMRKCVMHLQDLYPIGPGIITSPIGFQRWLTSAVLPHFCFLCLRHLLNTHISIRKDSFPKGNFSMGFISLFRNLQQYFLCGSYLTCPKYSEVCRQTRFRYCISFLGSKRDVWFTQDSIFVHVE